jgi:glycosyltransferase involved in cell wall biosynthesis
MRICLASPGEDGPPEQARAVARLARLLEGHHEVEVVAPPAEPSAELRALSWCCPEHRRSAGLWEAIRERFGERGPDYLEFPDHGALAFVPLQARLAADPLLERTLVGVRASPSAELCDLADWTRSRPERTYVAELERWVLRHADRLVWPGGDVLDLYRRHYTELELPAALRIGLPVDLVEVAPPVAAREGGGPLRILYAGDLRRGAGVLDLVEACLGLPDDEWELTLLGADSETATMGQSVRHTIEFMADSDPRVRIDDAVSPAALLRLLPGFDLAALPWLVGGWSELAIAAMRAGVPVLATPVGCLPELIGDGSGGWLTAGPGAAALGRDLARLQGDRGELERLREAAAGPRRAAELADPAPILAGYQRLAADVTVAVPRPSPGPATVTGIVPYFRASQHIAEAIASLLGQTHEPLEVLIVNDGSFEPEDEILAELAADERVTVVTQLNEGESAARNLAATLARGEYLVMLDSDNVLEPSFVERALAVHRANPRLAYVTSWLRMIDEEGKEMPDGHGYAALGNGVVEDDSRNWDGDTLALLPRRLFAELGYLYGPEGSMHSDWELYRWLRADGRFGAVIPARLARYRVRPGSLLRGHGEELRNRGWAESRDRNRTRRMQWLADA